MPTQCAYWDKFSVLENLTERQSTNLGKFLAHAFQLRCIPITMLKKFEFTQLGQEAPGAFFKSVMKEMACICSAQGNRLTGQQLNEICRCFGNLWKTSTIIRPKRVPQCVLRFRPTPLCEEPGFHEGAQSRANEDLKLYFEEYQGER